MGCRNFFCRGSSIVEIGEYGKHYFTIFLKIFINKGKCYKKYLFYLLLTYFIAGVGRKIW
jgi:hypothetical protein